MKDLKLSIIVCLFFSLLIISCKKKEDSTTDSKTNSPISSGCGGISSVTDIDGNIYNLIQIGNQCWFKENLRTTRFQNGDTIRNIVSIADWTNVTVLSTHYSAWANYGVNSVYGKLYNGWAVKDTNKICPLGFHVPTGKEIDSLTTYLGGINLAGPALKSTTLWATAPSNISATNSSGFTALPGGKRTQVGQFVQLGDVGYFAFLGGGLSNSPTALVIYYDKNNVARIAEGNGYGYSCRCIKD